MFRSLRAGIRTCQTLSRVRPTTSQGSAIRAARFATGLTAHSTISDPAESEALRCIEEGTTKLEEGDVVAAKELYRRSSQIHKNPSSFFNLGVTHFHLKEFDEAIAAWKLSLDLQPDSADTHTNLASAYLMSTVVRTDLALKHLETAASLCPDDAEIAFNLAVVLEATGNLEEALKQYQHSQKRGIERAALHIRNVSAKLLGQKIKEAEDTEKSSKP
ncbi:TPR-like protein [Mycena indigotica]|uniref:TPR-like protein n=1 Tax=Mycena indigotica TaxID=2126181 RepID=A0A8H6T564_9AGAR|nr:TPR-like protein [Mycena indigotica]KAF7309625.1 TPR-like protein [Mycena indigotica]